MFLAHGDLDALVPRFAIMKMLVKPANFEIPVAIAISNKRLGYPAEEATALQLKSHVDAAFQGVQMCLIDDIGKIRKLMLDMQGELKPQSKYTGRYGSQKINGSELVLPHLLSDAWMNPIEPDFGDTKNGYRYEQFSFNYDFVGPETIELPDGGRIEIHPGSKNQPAVVDYHPKPPAI